MGRKIRREDIAAYPTTEDAIMADLEREELLADLRDLAGSPLDVDYFWE